MLILFDIDATLLTSSKAGVLALERGESTSPDASTP